MNQRANTYKELGEKKGGGVAGFYPVSEYVDGKVVFPGELADSVPDSIVPKLH